MKKSPLVYGKSFHWFITIGLKYHWFIITIKIIPLDGLMGYH
jgi:hypothetical protein